MKKSVWIGVPLALLLVAQLVPVERSNPSTQGEVPATAEQREVLRRACYDCHSNETRWPWYARVAPVSWLVANDVAHGRKHVNFSTWDRYDAEERAESLEESWEMVDEGEMPLWFYVPLHPEARLDETDKRLLREWSGQGRAGESARED